MKKKKKQIEKKLIKKGGKKVGVAVPIVKKGRVGRQQQASEPRRSARRNHGQSGNKFNDFVMDN